MIDIHTHIIPGIDDGAEDYEEAFAMLDKAAKNGTEAVVLTPHYPNKRFGLEKSAAEYFGFIKTAAEKMSEGHGGVRLFTGAEMYCDSNTVNLIDNGEIITLGDTRFVLIEFSPGCHFAFMENTVRRLKGCFYKPVIAHAERYLCLQYDFRRVELLKESGCVIQMNTETVLGKNTGSAVKLGDYMLENRLADIVASDAHGVFFRSPDMSAANAETACRCSTRYADRLFRTNPMKLLNDENI